MFWLVMLLFMFLLIAPGYQSFAGIHKAPIIVPAYKIRSVSRYPLGKYRLYRSNRKGEAIPIPFQIDEINKQGDFVLPSGKTNNSKTGNGIFDNYDELSFMGNDVGIVGRPTIWKKSKPALLFEMKFQFKNKGTVKEMGAVYLAIHPRPEELVSTKYVVYDLPRGQIRTSRYNYTFDAENYLILDGVKMMSSEGKEPAEVPVIDSSTFYVKADLKYFLTIEAGHRSVSSELDAYKAGPVRTIVRVNFLYTLLKLNFEIGMYTEVSFFANSVILPAVFHNPLDGTSSLNPGSCFYYGFSLHDNPGDYDVKTNMRPYGESSILDFFKLEKKPNKYWISLLGEDRSIYVELQPSKAMKKSGTIPYFYSKNFDGKSLSHIDNDLPQPIEKSPVNMGLYFDLTKFPEGEQYMSFKLFFENKKDPSIIKSFQDLNKWQIRLSRIKAP